VGTLSPGDQLPSIRELAAELRINPSSAVKAYGELKHEHVIDMDQGRGTAHNLGPEIRWPSSYVTDNKMYCVYAAA
jgi:DNA-binding transcriptional regulator YhcF (GntR family)